MDAPPRFAASSSLERWAGSYVAGLIRLVLVVVTTLMPASSIRT